MPAIIYEEVKLEGTPVVDMEGQDNFYWIVMLKCHSNMLSLGYSEHLDKAARERVRKDHTPPAVFKVLMNGFRCD